MKRLSLTPLRGSLDLARVRETLRQANSAAVLSLQPLEQNLAELHAQMIELDVAVRDKCRGQMSLMDELRSSQTS